MTVLPRTTGYSPQHAFTRHVSAQVLRPRAVTRHTHTHRRSKDGRSHSDDAGAKELRNFARGAALMLTLFAAGMGSKFRKPDLREQPHAKEVVTDPFTRLFGRGLPRDAIPEELRGFNKYKSSFPAIRSPLSPPEPDTSSEVPKQKEPMRFKWEEKKGENNSALIRRKP